MKNEAKVKVNKLETNSGYDFLDAQHSGYKRLSESVTHRRQILFNRKEGYYIIEDILTGEGKHTFDLCFHFAPMKLEIEKENPLVVRSNDKGEANIAIIPMRTEGLKVSIEEGWVSYSYGKKIKMSVAKYSKVARRSLELLTLLYPFGNVGLSLERLEDKAMGFWRKVVKEGSETGEK